MNIVEFHQDIEKIIPELKLSHSYLSTGGGDTPYQVSNLFQLRGNISTLEKIKYLDQDIEQIKKTWLFNTANDQLRVTSSDRSLLEELLSNLRIKLTLLNKIAEDSPLLNRDDILFVKMPELKSFDELNKFSSDLKKSIELPLLHSEMNEKTEIVGADTGSIILYLGIGTALAVKLIAGICWAAAVIRKKNAEAKIFESHAKTLELKNESLSNIIESQKSQLKNILESEAMEIANKHFSHKDHETIERLKLSITTIADLIDRGAKILPMSQQEEIQKAFPDYNNLNLIESTIKQLIEKKD